MIYITDTAAEALLVRVACILLGAAVAAAAVCRLARLDKARHRPAYIALHASMGLWAGGRAIQAAMLAGHSPLDLHDLLGLAVAALYLYITYPLWHGTAVPPLAWRDAPAGAAAAGDEPSAQVLAMVRAELQRTRAHLTPMEGAAADVVADLRTDATTTPPAPTERQQP